MKKTVEITYKEIVSIVQKAINAKGLKKRSPTIKELVFFSFVYYGVIFGEKLFDARIVFNKNNLEVNFQNFLLLPPDINIFSRKENLPKIKSHIENVVEDYGKMSPKDLRKKKDTSFSRRFKKKGDWVIKWEEIINFYRENLIEIAVKEVDRSIGAVTIYSNIIPGLVCEFAKNTPKKIIFETVQEISMDLLENNCCIKNIFI